MDVSQPSDVGTGRAAAAGAFDSFFLGLGMEGLIVGAVGVASIMIISVLERRSEISFVAPWARRRGRSGRSCSPSGSCSGSPAAFDRAMRAARPSPTEALRTA